MTPKTDAKVGEFLRFRSLYMKNQRMFNFDRSIDTIWWQLSRGKFYKTTGY